MKLKHLLFVVIVYVPFCAYPQAKSKALNVGDNVPDIVFNMLVNTNQTRKLSDYKGKLLIIDCWSIYCAPCIKALPEIAELTTELSGKLNVLALEGGSPKDKVLQFLRKKKTEGEEVKLPIAHIPNSKKSIFYDFFPVLNYGFPVEIWINSEGKLIGITSSYSVNEVMINKVLSGDISGLTVKHYQKDFKRDQPFLIRNNGGPDSAFVYRSMITPFIDSIPSGSDFVTQRTAKFTRLFFANRTILELLKVAALKTSSSDIYNKLVELHVDDTSRYLRPKGGPDFFKIMKQQGYCYELILPPEKSIDDGFKFMLQDVQRYFSLNVTLKMKEITCLALRKRSDSNLKSTVVTSSYEEKAKGDSIQLKFERNNFNLLLSFLNRRGYPVIVDETQINYPVDVDLKIPNKYNLGDLNKTLNNIGLEVEEKMINKEILVISEVK